MNKKIVIGIEGPVGSGKTSICRKLLEQKEDIVLVNGGNIYRAIVFAILKSGVTLDELEVNADSINIKEMMDKLNVTIGFENKETILKIKDKKILEEELQSPEVSMAVSKISGSVKNKELFLFARSLIDELKERYNVIVANKALEYQHTGRKDLDAGSVIQSHFVFTGAAGIFLSFAQLTLLESFVEITFFHLLPP